MRILHLVRAPIGGIFRHLADLARLQAAQGHVVGILCDANTGGPFEAAHIAELDRILPLGVRRFPMSRSAGAGDLAALWRLTAAVAASRPDVLHGHGAKGGIYARLIGTALRLAGRPVQRIYCPHGGSLHFGAESLEGRLYFSVERLFERITDGLVWVSDYERASYRAKVGVPRVPERLAYNGLAAEEFEPVDRSGATHDFLHIGMLRKLKGTDVLLEALARLAARGTTATCLVVGVGDERPAFEAMARDLGLGDRVVFEDPMPIRRALARARAVVLPSRAESLPYVVLETIAAGTPIILTRVGGIPEIVGDRCGSLIPPGDAGALADAMAAMLADPARFAAEAVALRERIRSVFSIDAMARTVDGFYAELMEREGERGRTEGRAIARAPARASGNGG